MEYVAGVDGRAAVLGRVEADGSVTIVEERLDGVVGLAGAQGGG